MRTPLPPRGGKSILGHDHTSDNVSDMNSERSRRSFLEEMGLFSAGVLGVPYLSGGGSRDVEVLPGTHDRGEYGANDQINIALIGAGVMGQNDAGAALQNSGTQLVAACDLYDSRLERCQERWGEDVFTTRDYREVISRDDVDSVIIATSDHWHDQITIDALNAGKHVYCEKPMVHNIEEGYDVIEAEKNSDPLLQVGSQSTSSLLNVKARELFKGGAIGEPVLAEYATNRNSMLGAWNYSMPPSAGPENIDWDMYLKDLPEMPFSAEKFFRWRKYRNFGTGVAGDLFVHNLSALHFILDSLGPERIYGTGGIRFWEDGREVPDVMTALLDYPETENHSAFNCALRVNFKDGSVSSTWGNYPARIVGTEGEMVFKGGEMILRKSPTPNVPAMSIDNFSKDIRESFKEYHKSKHPDQIPRVTEEKVYKTADEGLGDTALHHKTLLDAIRGKGEIVQDGEFGLRAAAPALAANTSYFDGTAVNWDPVEMQVV